MIIADISIKSFIHKLLGANNNGEICFYNISKNHEDMFPRFYVHNIAHIDSILRFETTVIITVHVVLRKHFSNNSEALSSEIC